MEQLRREPERLLDRVLIVQGQNWHHGVIGIVASRITERFGKPCFVLSVSGKRPRDPDAAWRDLTCSGRFPPARICFRSIGGHPMAAGLSLAADRVEELRRKINQYACSLAPVLPALTVDCLVAPQEITLELADELALLEPVGTGNPPPLFGLFDASIAEISPIGGGKHLRLTVTKNGCPVRCVRFSVTQEEFPYRVGDQVDLALSVEAKEYMGSKAPFRLCAGASPGRRIRESCCGGRIRYEEARRGEALSPAVWQELYPTRDDFARLYRFLRSANGYQGMRLSSGAVSEERQRLKASSLPRRAGGASPDSFGGAWGSSASRASAGGRQDGSFFVPAAEQPEKIGMRGEYHDRQCAYEGVV